jgi:hypothetical protein|tara:strand:- start:1035 stop:1208 length:174 start_codon:yes stop_codon:yes gene_type:complete
MKFKNKDEVTDWALDQMNKYGIRHPDTYTEDEIAYACPEIPQYVINQHVTKRDKENT